MGRKRFNSAEREGLAIQKFNENYSLNRRNTKFAARNPSVKVEHFKRESREESRAKLEYALENFGQ